MLEVCIDGKETLAEKDEFVLALAKREAILIPTLCHHKAIAGLGSCRLCIVEVDEGRGPKVVVSCVYPLKEPCTIFTKSEKIIRLRRGIISMLRDRAPQDPYLQQLCTEYSVPQSTRYVLPPQLKCVLCGRCAAACAALGNGAITTVGRGTAKKVSTPYDSASADCIGCGACAQVCPVHAITCTETRDTRSLWNKTFRLVPCEKCGVPFTTQEALDLVREKTLPGTHANLGLCPDCRKKEVLLTTRRL
ncbi:MAG: 4Fe-4S dicluster domain-containing protein [Treponema sp.]|jgi:NADH dehydrogenase/NADH:ubiquinone oxidoreductase subunit G|nr:4Fe-4S dicluster domain-containing protein [Treponema sp.]